MPGAQKIGRSGCTKGGPGQERRTASRKPKHRPFCSWSWAMQPSPRVAPPRPLRPMRRHCGPTRKSATPYWAWPTWRTNKGAKKKRLAITSACFGRSRSNPQAKAGLLLLSPTEDLQALGSQSRENAEQNPNSAAAQSVLGHSLPAKGARRGAAGVRPRPYAGAGRRAARL